MMRREKRRGEKRKGISTDSDLKKLGFFLEQSRETREITYLLLQLNSNEL